jgi:hypothetical protein
VLAVRAPAVLAIGSALGVALAAFAAKPVMIEVGDVTIQGPLVMGPLVSWTRPNNIATANYALRIFGTGSGDIDRVKIRIHDPDSVPFAGTMPPVNVGATDFTIEFWMRAEVEDNTASAVTCGSNNNWINGNIVIDRDRFGQGRNYGLSIAGGSFVFGVMDSGQTAFTICGSVDVLDDAWHHIAVTRDESTGALALYVDGVLDESGTGPTGDISYPADGVPSQTACGGPCDFSDPFIVLGAEKHDAGSEFPSYSGLMDELRFSTTLRYTTTFSPPGRFTADAQTVGLYHFDEAADTILSDASGVTLDAYWGSVEPPDQDGALRVGGSPEGPVWVASGAPTG